MKKIVFMLFLLAFSGDVLAESCAGGQGVVIVAVNGKKYCRSMDKIIKNICQKRKMLVLK